MALPGAAYCAFCGGLLHVEPHVSVERSIPVPDPERLDGPCSVIYAGEGEMDVRRVGRLVAEAVERPLPDVTREMRTSKGFLATGLGAGKAVLLARRAEEELRAPVLVLPDDAVVPLPPALRMRQVEITGGGLRCEAYAWDQSEEVKAGWDQMFLISCGRLEIQEAVEAREESVNSSHFMSRRIPGLVMQKSYEFLLDIVLFDPWRRLRMDQNTAAFSLTELRQQPGAALGSLYRSATNLDRFAEGVPMNRGLALLAAGGAEAAWEPLTFLNKRDFDSYTYWLLQLVRYGRPIPG